MYSMKKVTTDAHVNKQSCLRGVQSKLCKAERITMDCAMNYK